MSLVALTGGIGSGKSAATQAFSSLGVPVVDLDIIARQVTAAKSPATDKIAHLFGDEYLTQEGALNRPKMRDLVFSDAVAREKLNAVLHPIIYAEALKQLAMHPESPYQVLVIPLLVESPRYRDHLDHVLLIDCDEDTQIRRVMQRNQFSESQARQMLQAQSSRQQRLAIADTVILNDGNLQELHKKITDFHKNYINTCIVSK
jgi:dephospho-CoA kinase